MLSMPFFMCLFPDEEFMALDSISIPSFARFSPIPLPACLRFLLIFVKAGAVKLTKILLLSLLRPMFLVFVTLMFVGSFFLLILSYFEMKDVPFGRFTTFVVGLCRKIIFLSSYSSPCATSTNYFPQYRFCYFS